ncbi:hypothetical protein EKD04_014415 [Chloroflexales bacterium ZM16-3]|nr:hypothetical protein [Chloroflexales bacterium ZM16-3]
MTRHIRITLLSITTTLVLLAVGLLSFRMPTLVQAYATQIGNVSEQSYATLESTDYVLQVLAHTNAYRDQAGCPALNLQSQLVQAAQRHSDDMALKDFVGHTGSDSSVPWDRIHDTGYQYSLAAENAAGGYSTPAAVVEGWYNSPGHQANMLNCALKEIGIGYAERVGTQYTHYWTQVFATTATTPVYTVSGRITASDGSGLSDVTVSDGTRTALSDSTGSYTLNSVPAGSYTLTPVHSGSIFSPASRSVTVSGNLSGQDFAAIAATYTVSGRITDSSDTGIAGVTVSDGTRTANTDSSGNYTLNSVPMGSYNLTPTRSGYSFSPTSRSITVNANLSGQDFIATANAFTISGRITASDGSDTPNIVVTAARMYSYPYLIGGSDTITATTASDGTYTISGVPAGTYMLTPAKESYSFSPTSRSITVSSNVTGQDFTSTTPVYTVSGRITTSDGSGLYGVTVSDGTRTATTDSSGNYTLNSVPVGSYTLTPTRSGYSFSPVTRDVTVNGNLSGKDFIATIVTYTISGRITASDGSGTPDIVVTATRMYAYPWGESDVITATTGIDGTYTISDISVGTYTLTPAKASYGFSPISRSITVSSDVTGQDFTSATPVYTVSGRITTNGSGLYGVTVSDGMRTATTDSNGNYTLNSVPVGSYTLTPTRSGYSFSPVTRDVTVNGNLSGKDFTATTVTYTISGWIATSDGTGIPGVVVTATKMSAYAYPWGQPDTLTATTGSNGTYTISNVPVGYYTLTPAKGDYTFSPLSRSVTVSGNLSGQDFTASIVTYSISGFIAGDHNAPLSGVTITDGTRSVVTNSSGVYTLSGVPAGTYTLSVSREGYAFSPASRSVTVSGDVSGQDFSGTMLTYTISGRVTDSKGDGIADVSVSNGTYSVTTGTDGRYTLINVQFGSYTLTPSKSGYTFSPQNLPVTVSSNLSGQDFTATPITYTVSGRVTNGSGVGIAGVIISAGSKAVTTERNGSYTISDLAAGSYTLTPSKSGYTFSPASRSVTVSRNLSGQDFVGASAEQGLVDVSISLYSNPNSTQRLDYEEIVRYFADGVFEESNGAHKLHTVTIYPNQGLTGRANIQWIASCWPNAHISGYGVTGLRVEMCDSFSNVNFLSDHEAGGYVLAHEWGHYYYSLYDEYRSSSACSADRPSMPCVSDTPVLNSIMNSQWNARGGNYSWLNFSTPLNNTRNTAEYRVYRASGWETLVRQPALDPRDGVLRNYPTRIYYPELAAAAPLAGQAPRIDLVANNTARSALQIVWANNSAPLAASQDAIIANVSALNGGQINYPEPIRVLAVLQRDHPIAGAVAQGEIIAPDGSSQTMTLRDDGVAPDTRANDGLYAALLTYSQDGTHTIRVSFTNNAGAAYEVADSGELAPPPPGTTPQLPVSQPITDVFDVFTELTVQVTGAQADDHGDTSATADVLATNGTNVAGQIDRAGDRDLFRITATSNGKLAVRVTDLALGMQPQMRVLAADGTTELARVDLSTSESTDYLLLTYTMQAGERVYIEVTHSDPAATQGFYRISAGVALANEVSESSSVYLPIIAR